jgi:hypothetical protein
MAITKHMGKYGEKPCVVVFREVPNEPENCLVVLSNGLEDRLHDDLMEVVQSEESQASNDISEVLNRRQFSNGENMLNFLHFNKKITKVPVSLVSLTPTPSQSVPLGDVNAEIRRMKNDPIPPKTDESHLLESAPVREVDTSEVSSDAAEGLLIQAQLMKEDAQRMLAEAEAKMAQAYELNPSLKPTTKKKPGRPPKEK